MPAGILRHLVFLVAILRTTRHRGRMQPGDVRFPTSARRFRYPCYRFRCLRPLSTRIRCVPLPFRNLFLLHPLVHLLCNPFLLRPLWLSLLVRLLLLSMSTFLLLLTTFLLLHPLQLLFFLLTGLSFPPFLLDTGSLKPVFQFGKRGHVVFSSG